jgi:hypothetical protein
MISVLNCIYSQNKASYFCLKNKTHRTAYYRFFESSKRVLVCMPPATGRQCMSVWIKDSNLTLFRETRHGQHEMEDTPILVLFTVLLSNVTAEWSNFESRTGSRLPRLRHFVVFLAPRSNPG